MDLNRFMIIVIVVALMAVFLEYMLLKKRFGEELSKRRLPFMIFGLLFAFVLVYVPFFLAVKEGIFENIISLWLSMIVALGWIALAAGSLLWLRGMEKSAGKVLLDLGHRRYRSVWIAASAAAWAIAAVVCKWALDLWPNRADHAALIVLLTDGLGLIALGVFLFVWGTRRKQLRENGVLRFGRLLPYALIAERRWEDRPSEAILSLDIRLGERFQETIVLRVPPQLKDAADGLLQERKHKPAA